MFDPRENRTAFVGLAVLVAVVIFVLIDKIAGVIDMALD